MTSNINELNMLLQAAECIFTEKEVDKAMAEMAKAITARLGKSDPIVLCVMHGGLILTGRLLPMLPFPLTSGYLHATRYGHQQCGGHLDWRVRPTEDLRDRSVLLIDDILDEGETLSAIVDYCREEGAREVLTAVLVNKVHDRKSGSELEADFVGLNAPDRFLFGCGMDFQGYWRNAAGIYAVKGL